LVLDSGKQPQRLSIVARLEQIWPEDVLRRRQFAVREEAPGLHDLGRQVFQAGDALGCNRCISFVPSQVIQAFEHDPAICQRRVEVHGSQKGIDRARRIPQGYVAITTLLVEEAEPRMLLLQEFRGCQCLVNQVQASLVGGDQIQDVAVLGRCSYQRCSRQHFGRGERFAVPPALAELTDAANVEFDRRGRGRTCHGTRSR
jgi:hypothetical protein